MPQDVDKQKLVMASQLAAATLREGELYDEKSKATVALALRVAYRAIEQAERDIAADK